MQKICIHSSVSDLKCGSTCKNPSSNPIFKCWSLLEYLEISLSRLELPKKIYCNSTCLSNSIRFNPQSDWKASRLSDLKWAVRQNCGMAACLSSNLDHPADVAWRHLLPEQPN
ncbi:hypothetical protein AVEN_148598-1 [Araneus ventricosus]|uniref:Uncharacterized protein n=1 Tax=Araneus ventricosus TaxID=182803 RepID=A0A4Y2WLX6_ARAVE|nr:hypothetical protein AVEN_148598-1 [Araneus ventricosus]